MDNSLQAIDHLRVALIDMAVQFGPKLVVAILIMTVGVVVGRWVTRPLQRLMIKMQLEVPVRTLLTRIVQLLVLGLFSILALQNLGVELLPLIAGLGVAGAGIALAMQGVLGNVAAGLVIIFVKPFRVGDYISIAGEEGEVLDVSLFNTTLGHLDRSSVVIPNRKIGGEILHNYGRIRQLDIGLAIAHGSNVDLALRLIDQVLRANVRVLAEPAPVCGVKRITEAGIVIAILPWVSLADYLPAIAELNKALLESFRAHAIVIPLPQREVRLIGTDASAE